MTTVEPVPPTLSAANGPWRPALSPLTRILLRWFYIGVATCIAFPDTLANLAFTVYRGGVNSFLVVLPVLCLIAAAGVALRNRTELPIHDRETDVIVGIAGLVFAMLLHTVLLGRYAEFFHLLRLDLLALLFFVLSSSIALFGLRPVYRFRWVWALALVAACPLPYHVALILMGGTRTAAGAAMVIAAAVATGIAVGRKRRRGVKGAVAALIVGFVVLFAMRVTVPDAPLLAYQAVPSVSAAVLVSGSMLLHRAWTEPTPVFHRTVEPLAAKHVWSAVPLVLIIALGTSLADLPDTSTPYASPQTATSPLGGPLEAPAGWHIAETEYFAWVSRVYGEDAHLIRQRFVADEGNPLWDKFARPRAIVVDTITTARPYAFHTYPARVLYPVTTVRQSSPRWVDLGHGVEAKLVDIVDDDLLITWNAIDFTWGNDKAGQQITAFAVDDHEPEALFPSPTGALIPTLETLFTVLLRGNAAVTDASPEFKDQAMLTDFGRGLVEAQLRPDPQP